MHGFRPSFEPLEERTLLSHTSAMISGDVFAAGDPWVHARVTLYEAGAHQAKVIGTDISDSNGEFDIRYRRAAAGSLLYVVASEIHPAHSSVLLVGVVGEVGANLVDDLVVNEYTTVSSVYALSQFIDGVKIHGASPGLDNAFTTTFNLVDPSTGTPAEVVSNELNGGNLPRSTLALQTLNTLANALAACSVSDANCDLLFDLTTIDGVRPTNTIDAIQNIVQNPVGLDNQALFDLAATQSLYTPTLTAAPDAWVVALHYVQGGFNAPGRIAFDAQGNVWSNNNFALPIPGTDPGMQVTVLSPTGDPIFDSPINGNGVFGSAYGVAIGPDGRIWIGNFGDSSMSVFGPDGAPLGHFDSSFGNLNHPMGMAFDQYGNQWIPNFGDPNDPTDFGSVTVYLKSDPNRALTFTRELTDPLEGIHKPWSIAIDSKGRAWVANSGLGPVGSVSVLELKRGRIRLVQQITHDSDGSGDIPPLRPFSEFAAPKTIAVDSHGNAWLTNFENNVVVVIDGKTFETREIEVHAPANTWGLAVDGSNRLWVGSFTNSVPDQMLPPFISLIQGNGADGEFLYSFSNPALQHVTALQLDASGNVWAVNNWALDTTPDNIVGGDGLVEFIGLATPVKTPLVDQNDPPRARHADRFDHVREAIDAIRDKFAELREKHRERQQHLTRTVRDRALAELDGRHLNLIEIGDAARSKASARRDESRTSDSTPAKKAMTDAFQHVFAKFDQLNTFGATRVH